MKRFLLVVCMTVAVLVLFACGSGQKEREKWKAPDGTKAAAKDEPQNASDGAASGKQPVISDNEAFNRAEEIIKNMTLEEKVAQMFLVELSQLDPPKKASGRRYRLTKKMKEELQGCAVGGVYLTERNVRDQEQTKKLVSDIQSLASGGAMYVAAEEECAGGHSLAGKVKAMRDPANVPAVGQASEPDGQVYRNWLDAAGELRRWGFNLNLAPVADIGSETNPGYASRCFGTDADTVSDMLTEAVNGIRDGGLAVTLKYFPGLGSVTGDYEEDILDNQESLMTLRNNNFSVYADGIEAGADCVMMSNTAVSKITVNNKLPAFLSQEIVTNLLREEVGFEGVIMTPPLNSRAVTKSYTVEYVVVEAVKAGCDMIIMPEDLKRGCRALLDAVVSGKIDEKVINTSVRRILQDKIRRQILVINENQDSLN